MKLVTGYPQLINVVSFFPFSLSGWRIILPIHIVSILAHQFTTVSIKTVLTSVFFVCTIYLFLNLLSPLNILDWLSSQKKAQQLANELLVPICGISSLFFGYRGFVWNENALMWTFCFFFNFFCDTLRPTYLWTIRSPYTLYLSGRFFLCVQQGSQNVSCPKKFPWKFRHHGFFAKKFWMSWTSTW